MAAAVANPNISLAGGPPGSGINKRYRPAPAKTFQCRGYGECRMVFSRSEHLARHIRKHTGERPFTCHCGKQFSRLDNLRQHAQTVHSDKQEQNEQMMRDLTSLHANMAAANKSTTPSTGRRAKVVGVKASAPVPAPISVPTEASMRPGTTTGYEGDGWQSNGSAGGHSFRGDSFRDPQSAGHQQQSFLAPVSSSQSPSSESFRGPPSHSFRPSPPAAAAAETESFRPQSSSFRPSSSSQSFRNFSFPTSSTEQSASGSRPPTRGEPLPPLSSVVSIAAANPLSIPPPTHPTSTQQLLPLRRPSTGGGRPGTAPASFFPPASYYGGSGLVSRPSAAPISFGSGGSGSFGGAAAASDGESPFSFHPPEVSSSPSAPFPSSPSGLLSASATSSFSGLSAGSFSTLPTLTQSLSTSSTIPAKRPADDDGGYDYGSESRPASRRLSVMELCNDGGDGPLPPAPVSRPGTGAGPVRPGTGGGRPATASTLISALRIRDSDGGGVLSHVEETAGAAAQGFGRSARDGMGSGSSRMGASATVLPPLSSVTASLRPGSSSSPSGFLSSGLSVSGGDVSGRDGSGIGRWR